MKMTATKQIGKNKYTFFFEGKNLYEVVMEAQKLSFRDIPLCGCCKGDNLILDAHLAQGKFKYVSVKCLDCKASLTFGQKQDDPDTYYPRRNEQKQLDWKAYKE